LLNEFALRLVRVGQGGGNVLLLCHLIPRAAARP
jgi:hypothetical protein